MSPGFLTIAPLVFSDPGFDDPPELGWRLVDRIGSWNLQATTSGKPYLRLAKLNKLRRLAVKATEKMINVWTYQT